MTDSVLPQLAVSSFRQALIAAVCILPSAAMAEPEVAGELHLNEFEYLSMPGVDVMLAHDFYPEGHQGGVGLIMHDQRLATNGDIRLEPTPGQWQPVPAAGEREIDPAAGEMSVRMAFPDPEKDRKGFNPIIYPDLEFAYRIRVSPAGGSSFRIRIDLEEPLPEEWIGRVGFNWELFPGILFGKSYNMDGAFGIFPRQANGPGNADADGGYQVLPLAEGERLSVAPETEDLHVTIEVVNGGGLQLLDGRAQHNNGWFVVRSLIPSGATEGAVEWVVTPRAIPDFKRSPVVQVSQVGYHPEQGKRALVELDGRDTQQHPVQLWRVDAVDGPQLVLESEDALWGEFLRYRYLSLDFTEEREPGIYVVSYGEKRSSPFQIGPDVFSRHVWQPTLEYFLPVQMCHVRVNDRYRVWHGACHLDDARMAPVDHNHFDGYLQGASTLTEYESGESIPGLNEGGWHDAGDYDLRIESQSGTMHGLALAYEEFGVTYDNTSVDQVNRVVELHHPDGQPDILQQIEHGALSVVGGYRALGRLYRGIITPTLRQYVLLGDAVNQTDNVVFDPARGDREVPPVGLPGSPDDRWVFTEENPRRELMAAAGLAASARALRGYNDALAAECLEIAESFWQTEEAPLLSRVALAVELLLATGGEPYVSFFKEHVGAIADDIENTGWYVVRVLDEVDDLAFKEAIAMAVRDYRAVVDTIEERSPYGVPYEPDIWGAGWSIQRFGMRQYYLHQAFPDIFPRRFMLNALNFILGVHPGSNTVSFVSGVGAESMTVAYGINRGDWSHIPGGSGSGTALIRPDFPELLEWPFLWQQTEYVMGGGTTDYLFLALAAEAMFRSDGPE